jgi:hypothetical protein
MKAITKEARSGKARILFTTYQCTLLERIGDETKVHNYVAYDNYNVGVLINRGLVLRTLKPNGDILLTLSHAGKVALKEYNRQQAETDELTRTIRDVVLEANSLQSLWMLKKNRYQQMCDSDYEPEQRRKQYDEMVAAKNKYEQFVEQLTRAIQ